MPGGWQGVYDWPFLGWCEHDRQGRNGRKAATGLIAGFNLGSQAGIDYHVQVFVSDGGLTGSVKVWINLL